MKAKIIKIQRFNYFLEVKLGQLIESNYQSRFQNAPDIKSE